MPGHPLVPFRGVARAPTGRALASLPARRLGAQCALALALLGTTAERAAADDALPISVEYQAIEGCPAEDAFWTALSSRATRVQRSEVSGATATLRISVILTPQGVLGRLQIVRRDRTTEPRFVEAASCEEVVEALALTAALSVEGEAADAPAPVSAPPPPSPERPKTQHPVEDSPYTEQGLPFDYIEQPNVSSSDDWETQLQAHGVAAFIVDESASTGFGGRITFSRRRQGWPSPALGLGVAALSTALTDGDSKARFSLTEAEFVGCPTTLGQGFAVRPCAVFQLGILDASGKELSNPETAQGMWWAPGLGVFAETPNRGLLRFQFAFQAVIPLRRQVYKVGIVQRPLTQTMGLSPWLTVGVAIAP